MSTPENSQLSLENKADAYVLADFILSVQKSVILNLSKGLNIDGVSYPQLFLLMYLASEKYLTMTDIAKKMWHTTAAATGLVDRLEKKDLVERFLSADDRRKIMVQLTAQGSGFVAKKRAEISLELQKMLIESEAK